MVAGLFDENDFLEILRSRFKSNVEFIEEEWVSFSQDVEGFMGEHYLLNLKYRIRKQEGVESFFVKTLPRRVELQGQIAKETDVYEKEIFLYSFIMEEFMKAGYDTSFAPRCYYFKNGETIVLENLKEKKYKCVQRGQFYDVDHCRKSLDALAIYHGNCVAYEEKRSEELGREYRICEQRPGVFRDVFFLPGDTDGLGAQFMASSKKCLQKLLPLSGEPEEWRRELLGKVERFDCAAVFHQDLPSRKTCTHGDLWSNNMMFRYSNDVPVKCCLLDFQLVRHHHPVFDALLVVYSNTTRDFRQNHLEQLVDHYYASLGRVLAHHGLDHSKIFPRDDFTATARALEPVALFQGFATRTLVLLPKQVTNEVMDSGSVALKDLLFTDRPSLLYNHCLQDERARKMFLGDLRDLYDRLD